MAVKDLTSKLTARGRSATVFKAAMGWSPRFGEARQGKVVDVLDVGAFGNLDTVNLTKLGLKQVYEVWQPCNFALSAAGTVVTAPVGALIPISGPIRFIGR